VASIRERRWSKDAVTFAVLFRLDGKQKSITRDTEAEAVAVRDLIDAVGAPEAVRILAAKATGTVGSLTVSDVIDRHIDGLSGVQPFTITTYRTMARQIAATPLGHLPAELADRDSVAAWIRSQEDAGVASKTIRNRHALLSAALQRASEEGVVTRNVAHRARIGRTERREMTFLTPREFRVLLARATPHYRPLLVTMYGTGLRLGEVTALRPEDLSLEHRPPTLTVARAWKKDGRLGAPKSEKGRRTIALGPQVVVALTEALCNKSTGDLLFTNLAGRRILQATVHDNWQAWIEDTVIDRATGKRVPRTPLLGKRPRMHDLRHSHAATMLAQGLSIYDLSRRLGHESIKTTGDTYGHLMPESLVVAARAAELAYEVPVELEQMQIEA
jgi:integrase